MMSCESFFVTWRVTTKVCISANASILELSYAVLSTVLMKACAASKRRKYRMRLGHIYNAIKDLSLRSEHSISTALNELILTQIKSVLYAQQPHIPLRAPGISETWRC
jgi:hypothetical protein